MCWGRESGLFKPQAKANPSMGLLLLKDLSALICLTAKYVAYCLVPNQATRPPVLQDAETQHHGFS